tara:strand:- start:812 stop:1291 length:480 start_codon:yes stop_codon:yes gene_type:complete
MSSFSTEFTLEDVTILQDAVGHWESSDDSFLGFCEKLRSLGDPPEEIVQQVEEQAGHGGFMDWWSGMKSEVLGREQKAKDDKKRRMDEACLLKTKLILLKRTLHDAGIDSLFDENVEAPKEDEVSRGAKTEPPKPDSPHKDDEPPKSATEPPPRKNPEN